MADLAELSRQYQAAVEYRRRCHTELDEYVVSAADIREEADDAEEEAYMALGKAWAKEA